MAAPDSSPAPPLHVQHLHKALRVEPFLAYVERVFSDPVLANLSDDPDELSDFERGSAMPDGSFINGDGNAASDCLSPDELRIDKSRMYNFNKVKRDRKWLRDLLLSDSSDSSDEDQPLTDEDLREMLWLHKQQRLARHVLYTDGDLSSYQHYSASLLGSQHNYHDIPKQPAPKKVRRKKVKEGGMKFVPFKEKKSRIKRRKRKADDGEEEYRVYEERPVKKTQSRRKEADGKRRKLWALIVRKEIPRAHRQKTSARNTVLANAKKLAQMCQKEMRKEAQRSQKITQQAAPRARRLNREMMVYWKKYEKVEKEHRKRAEKEAQEQRKRDDELLEARRQQRKLNFLITQTELYAHFMSKKIKGTMGDEGAEEILKKLDESSTKQNLKTVTGGVLIDMENTDNYDAGLMKEEALRNARRAVMDQEARTKAFDDSCDTDKGKMVPLTQESFDSSYSLANPTLGGHDHPQPQLLNGTLKSYQLKGMNWLVNLYEQGINGILADEMGLGKTVQSIAFLSYLAETHNIWGPFLVVAPASTLHNWQQEVTRFIPPFKVLPYWGNQVDRKSLRKYWSQKQSHINDRVNAPFHVLITSYQLVVQDVRYFQRIKWQYVVLDEAQAIKSSSSVRWKILLGFQCRNRLLLTGTPIQNSMAELWALLHFIMPTLFDSHEEFNEWFSKDIESHAENKTSVIDQNQLSRLHMILKPFMLRRIKSDVENELSDKIEIKLVCHLTTRQRWLYQAVKNKISIDDLVYTSASSSSTASATTSNLMNLVMQFRKVCNHPELFERRDVRSPAHVEVPPFHLPKLIYREGIIASAFPSRKRIMYNTFNIWTAEYIHRSLFPRTVSKETGGCFSCSRFIGVSPEEMSAIMLKGVEYRILALVLFVKDVRNLYHRRSWIQEQSRAEHIGRHDLVLHPDFTLSFPEVQSSAIFSSLVFTGYTRRVVSHLNHTVRPILSDEDGKPVRQRSRTKSQSGGSARRASATSPTKSHHRHPQHHPVRRPSTGTPPSPIKRSPTGAFSPTGSSRHQARVPISPTKGYHHPQSHLHTGPSAVSASLTAPVPPLELTPGNAGAPPFSAGAGPPLHSPPSSLLVPMTQLVSVQPAEPVDRTLQPTRLPPFLQAYIPRVVATNKICHCVDRSAAYEVEQLLLGGSRLARSLYLYGTPDPRECEESRKHLFPQPCGGLEASRPQHGWSFVQIPDRNALITDSGKLTVLDGLLTKLKAQGHRVLIYSQMTRMIDLLEEYMTYRKHKYMRLDGSSKISERRDMVADFQTKSDIFVFLLSTRAGGLGINLTAADTVIFYDSDWNPTVDQQAMDRAHRLGQTRQVTVYRLVIKGTIEERILQRAKEKSEIQRMVISGGNFKPDALKPKEVVSLLLDDAELESKFLMRQAEKKADEQRRRRERKRKKGELAAEEADGTATPVPKGKKGRKSKGALVPPAPEGGMVSSKPASEASSTNGEVINISRVYNELDDISVLSLDEVSLASGDASLGPGTPLLFRPDGGGDDSNLDEARSQDNSPASFTTRKRGRGRGRGRGRARGTTSTRGRGSGSVRTARGRGRGRGGGALAASVAASAAAAAASAAVFSAYGFAFQGTATTSTPPPSRSSPVAFGNNAPVVGAYSPTPGGVISQPAARYDNTSAYSPGHSAESSPARIGPLSAYSGQSAPPHAPS